MLCASFLSFVSVRWGLFLAAMGVFVGSVLRCFVNNYFELAFAGQYVLSVSYCFSRSSFTFLSSRLFFPKNVSTLSLQRAFATALLFSFNSMFLVVGFYLPFFSLGKPTTQTQSLLR